jgi:DNA-directed RNA polymerase sigma subunit (sigma70/sigma32)
MSGCLNKCRELKVSCPVENSECRNWIESEEDLNCVLQAVKNNDEKPITLRKVGEKLGLTHVAISYIESAALKKIKTKTILNDF